MAELCREFDISRPVGYEWLRRYQQGGIAGIAERSRRPQCSPRRKEAAIEQQVIALRHRYPDWGARKLRVLLREQGADLARNTIHRILLRHGLVHPEDRHEVAMQRFERSRPNELWQMDFKGPKLWHQPVGPLSVLDDHSRYLIALEAVGSTRSEVVREQLETAFLRCGVPEQMLMDHGVPWWSARSSGGMTELSLWLMRQGVELHWSRVRHPQTQGKVERFHGELQRALARRRVLVPDVQAWLDEFRWEHNHVRPHDALGMERPLAAERAALRSAATALGVSHGSQGAEGGLSGQADASRPQLEDQRRASRGVGASGEAGRTDAGLLLLDPGRALDPSP